VVIITTIISIVLLEYLYQRYGV